jgi:hypothetical protein
VGIISVFNKSKRRYTGVRLPRGKFGSIEPGQTVSLDEKDAEDMIRRYPRDLVKASEVQSDRKDLKAAEAAIAEKETALAAREAEIAKREEAMKEAIAEKSEKGGKK